MTLVLSAGLKASLPAGWANADIGTASAAGLAAHDAATGIFTLQGTGAADIAGTTDHFQFAYRPLSGDGYIVARIASLTPTNAWSKAGVMIRETIDGNSKHALMMVTPTSGTGIKYRTATGGATTQVMVTGAAPRWLKLERRGKMITGFESADGVTWNVVQRVALAMDTDVLVGLVACSRASALATMTADQVIVDSPDATVALPWPWTEQTVGAPADAGVALYDGSYVLSNLGADIAGAADKMKYVSQTLIGDGMLTVKVASVASSDNSTRLGLMMRDSFDANARNVLLGLTTSKSATFMSRRTLGGSIASRATAVTVAVPAWLRLQREGNVFTAWRSADGVTWIEHGTETLDLGPVLEVGLAYSNRHATTWAIGVGDGLTLTTPADTDGNGLADAWELQHFGALGIDPSADPDGDGLANSQEWELGNDPLVFNVEGQHPLLEFVGSSQLTGNAGALVSPPLTVRVKDSLSGDPVANVPVSLWVTRGEGRLGSLTPGVLTLNLLSDANGLVQAPFILPATGGLSFVNAGVGGGAGSGALTFSLNALVGEASLLFNVTDLGLPASSARVTYSEGNYTVSGATVSDNSGASDNSAFVWRDFTGDGYLLARVGFDDATQPQAQAGLMLRESLDAASPNIALVLTLSNGVVFQGRDTSGGASSINRKTGVYGPLWLLLRRSGDVISGFYSADGVTWHHRGTRTLALGATVKAGFTLGTRTTVYNSATFEGLRMGALSEAPWQVANLGNSTATVLDDFAEDSIFIRAGGTDITGTADAFHYVYQALPGDGRLTAQVATQLAVKSTTKSSLMIRESLEPGSRNVTLSLTPASGVILRTRAQTNGTTTSVGTALPAAAPHWLRLERLGPKVNAYASADGETWSLVGSLFFNPGATPLIGLAASSNDTSAHTQTRFDHLALEAGEGSLGWNGTYYEGAAFNASRHFRRDASLDFTWPASQIPAPGVPAGAYSVRWQADVVPAHSETYTFKTLSEGGVRVTVNGQSVIDHWTPHPLTEDTGTIALIAGQPSRVVVEYAGDTATEGRIRLAWASASQPEETIPFTSVLAIDSDDDGLPDAWEIAHGLNPHDPADAAFDPDGDILTNLQEYELGGNPNAADDRLPGAVTMEIWTGILGKSVREFTKHAKFHEAPDIRAALTRLDAPQNAAENYGRRIRGYIVAPATGAYQFHLAANESAELWLSPDDNPFARVKIARVSQTVAPYDYHARIEQHSTVLTLQAGQHYYFEILHKESSGADHLTVAWTRPGVTTPETITGVHLATFGGHADDLDGDGLPDSWELAGGLTAPLPLTALGSYNDADGDRLVNLLEYQHGTNPLNADTDGDGTDDFLERLVSHDPLTVSDLDLLPWTLSDIGHVNTNALAVAARIDTDAYALAGTGSGITLHKADGLRFLHREVTGDFEFTTRIVRPASSLTGYAGISIRESLSGHAPGMTLLQSVEGLNRTSLRTSLSSDVIQLPAFTPAFASEQASLSGYWFRLRRVGDVVSLHYSADGQYWIQSCARSVPLPETCLIGMVICHDLIPGVGGLETELPVRHFHDVSLITDLTSPASPEIVPPEATATVIGTLHGNAGVAVKGQWSVDGDDLVSQTFTGTLDYTFTVPADGLYRLTFTALSTSNPTTSTLFPVEISVNGQFVARVDLVLPLNEEGLARVISPWLTAGTHTVRLFYDNTLSYHPLRIRSLTIEQLGGLDADANGRADWIDARLQALNTINAGDGELYVSPASLDGKTLHRSLFQLTVDGLPAVVNPAPGFGWYANVPLSESAPVEIVGDFENSGHVQGALLTWKPLNLLALSEDDFPLPAIRIRKGDRLRLTAHPIEATAGAALVTITKPGSTPVELVLTDAVAQPLAHAFETAGTYTVTAVYEDGVNTPSAASAFTVEVIEAAFASDPVTGLNNTPVTWDNPGIFDDVLLEIDQGLLLVKQGELPAGGTRFSLSSANVNDSYVVARLGLNGPIFCHATVSTVRAATVSDTAMDVLQVYPDGSQLIGVPVIVNRLTDDTRVEITITTGGVTFEDGTTFKVLTKADFDEYGRIYLKFIYPTGVSGSICHRVHVLEGDVALGLF